jgi:cation-transporting ATPase E
LAALVTFVGYALARAVLDLSLDQSRTTATLILVSVGLVVLVRLAQPLSAWRAGLVASMVGSFALALLLPFTREFFALELPPADTYLVVAALVAAFDVAWRLARHWLPALRLDDA